MTHERPVRSIAPMHPLAMTVGEAEIVAHEQQRYYLAADLYDELAEGNLDGSQKRADHEQAERLRRLAPKAADAAFVALWSDESHSLLPEKSKQGGELLMQDYFEHGLAFYGAIAKQYENDPKTFAERWDDANVLMAEFTARTANNDQDRARATTYFDKVQNSVKKWQLVAGVHSQDPFVAQDWKASLHYSIEEGVAAPLDLLAMYKAEVSMAFDRAATTRNKLDRRAYTREAMAVWGKAEELLDKHGREFSSAEKTKVEHMADFARLFCDNGQFKQANAMFEGVDIWRDSTPESVKALGATLEVRELFFGKNEDYVRRQGGARGLVAALGGGKSEKRQLICQAILDPDRADRELDPRQLLTGWDSEAARLYGGTAAYGQLFLQEQYPRLMAKRKALDPRIALEAWVGVGEWGAAQRAYTERVIYEGNSQEMDMMRCLYSALLIAGREKEIEASTVVQKGEADILTIQSIAGNLSMERAYIDTAHLPAVRDKTNSRLTEFLEYAYGTPDLQVRIYKTLLEADHRIQSSPSNIRKVVRDYVASQLHMLELIPETEGKIEAQKAILQNLVDEAQG